MSPTRSRPKSTAVPLQSTQIDYQVWYQREDLGLVKYRANLGYAMAQACADAFEDDERLCADLRAVRFFAVRATSTTAYEEI